LRTIGDVAQRVERLPRMQEVGGSNPPISTRHTFASYLAMVGVGLATVSKLLGHKNISTTMIYSHLSQDLVI